MRLKGIVSIKNIHTYIHTYIVTYVYIHTYIINYIYKKIFSGLNDEDKMRLKGIVSTVEARRLAESQL
jgi:hypothetical protein